MNLVQEVMDYISQYDPEVGKGLEAELARQRRNLELIASENIVSPAVMLAMGTVPTNKYAEGYPGRRYYGGCEHVGWRWRRRRSRSSHGGRRCTGGRCTR